MKFRKYLLIVMTFTLILSSSFHGGVEAKPKSVPILKRVILNGEVVLDTHYQGEIAKVIEKHKGQTIVILPQSSFTGIWKKQPAAKYTKGSMVSVLVNGKPELDSKVLSKVLAVINKSEGKRVVIKPSGASYPTFSPERAHTVVKGPYAKETLQDYLKKLMAITNELNAKQSQTKVIKKWIHGAVHYVQYANGSVVSFSVQKTKDPRVRIVREYSKKHFILLADSWLQNNDENFKMLGFMLGGIKVSTKRVNGYFIITFKSGKEIYEEVYKSVNTFSC